MLFGIGEIVGTVGSENSFFERGEVQLPPVAEKGVLVPGVVPGVMPSQRVFPPRNVAPPPGVAVAVGVGLLFSPPGEVIGEEGFLGETLRGEPGEVPCPRIVSPHPSPIKVLVFVCSQGLFFYAFLPFFFAFLCFS